MRLRDFTYFPAVACRMTFLRSYEWIGNGKSAVHRSMPVQLWFYFVSVNMNYQVLGMAIYMWLVKPEEEYALYLEELSESLSIFGFSVVGACSFFTLVQHRSAIESLLAELELLFPKHGSKFYQTNLYYERSTRQMRQFIQFFIISLVIYNLEPIARLVYELSFESQKFQYKYQSNIWYPWHLLTAPDSIMSFAATYLFQIVSSITGVSYIMAGQFWLCFFINQMELHFDALAGQIQNLDASQPGANDQLKELLRYHDHLLRITREINHVFNSIFLISFTAATIGICMFAFSLIMVKQMIPALRIVQGMLVYLVFLFCICSNGSKLTDATDKVMPVAVYNNWYEGDAAYRKMILFLTMQSYKPLELRVYDYTPVSIKTYMDILKLSYQMFAFFQSVIE